MPFYEYECQACKYYTEVMQKITEAPLTKCPSCGKRKLKKLVSAPVFRLKGAGWYETDFKTDKDNKRNLVGADKEEPKSDAKAAETKDGKPEAKEAKESKEPKESKESKESKEPKGAKDSKESRSPQRKLPRRKPKAAARKAPRKGRR
jgi:putative FmdB family regulatory protein